MWQSHSWLCSYDLRLILTAPRSRPGLSAVALAHPHSIQRTIHPHCYNHRVSQSSESSLHEFVVAESEAGQRLDQRIASRFSSISRTRVQELIASGFVLVNSPPPKGSHRLHSAPPTQTQIHPPPPPPPQPQPTPPPLPSH